MPAPEFLDELAHELKNQIASNADLRDESELFYEEQWQKHRNSALRDAQVVTTNDDTMARHDAGYELRGATLRRACRIGGGAVLVPGVEVGDEAYVAAGAVVTRDVPPRAVVIGVPARVVRQVGDRDLLERWR